MTPTSLISWLQNWGVLLLPIGSVIHINNSLREVLYIWFQFYNSKGIQIRTSQRESEVWWEDPHTSIVLFVGCQFALSSWHINVWQYAEDCHTRKSTWTLVSRVFIGVSLFRHDWWNHLPWSWSQSFYFSNFSFLRFIFERERERASRGRTEREGERIPSRLCTASTEPDVGLELMNHEVMTRAKVRSWMLKPAEPSRCPKLISTFGVMASICWIIILSPTLFMPAICHLICINHHCYHE